MDGDGTRRYPRQPQHPRQPPRGPDPTRRFDGPDPTVRHATQPGRVLGGRYRLEGLLGAGGMADVYRASDQRLGRPVAVKVFRPGTDPDGGRRFSEEAQILANLRHPGLVAVHDYAVEGAQAYLVMELVDGPTLRQVFDEEQLEVHEVERIGTEIAQVLAFVHDEGVVHRDIKPSNVLLDRDNRVRLADFGVSRLVDSTGMTGVGDTVGTASYMAPEQVRGEHVGPPADVYAMGLVLLEALSGRPEYPGTGWDTATARLDDPPRIPQDVPGPLPRALRAMTAASPTRRPTARQAAGMLTEPVVDEPEAPPRSRAPLVVGLLLAVLVLIGGIAWATGGGDQTDVAQPGTSETPSAEPAPDTTEEAAPETGSDSSDGPDGSDPGSDGGGGFDIPTDLPDLPEIPEFTPPEIPESVTNTGEEARSWWETVSDWFSSLF